MLIFIIPKHRSLKTPDKNLASLSSSEGCVPQWDKNQKGFTNDQQGIATYMYSSLKPVKLSCSITVDICFVFAKNWVLVHKANQSSNV